MMELIKCLLILLMMSVVQCQTNTTAMVTSIDTSGLAALYDAANTFISLVFIPFGQMTDYFVKLLGANDIGAYLSSTWQDVLKAQAGFIACLAIGVLFIGLVPLVGFTMCLCRCCCNNCGGKKIQSRKRVKSKWRIGLCIGLLCCTVLIAVPGIIIILSNESMTTVIKKVPDHVDTIIQNLINYLQGISAELQLMLDQFDVLSTNLISTIEGMRNHLAPAILASISAIQNPVFLQLTQFGNHVTSFSDSLTLYEESRTVLATEIPIINSKVDTWQSAHFISLGTCTTDPTCITAVGYIAAVDKSADFSTAPDRSATETFMRNYVSNCGVLISSIEPTVQATLTSEIESAISDSVISSANESLQTGLNSARATFVNLINQFNLNTIEQLLVKTQTDLKSYTTTYSGYDQYRSIALLVSGGLLLLISACFVLAIFLGTCCGDAKRLPTKRKAASNFGGNMAMSGAGLSFIFSWLLMPVVIIFFLIGGLAYSYICVSFSSPYEGLQFIDKNIKLPDNLLGDTSSFSLDGQLYNIITSCQRNDGLITALNLTHLIDLNTINETLFKSLPTVTVAVTLSTSSLLESAALTTCLETMESQPAFANILSTSISSFPSYTSTINRLASLLPTSSNPGLIQNAINDLNVLQGELDALLGNHTAFSSSIIAINNLLLNVDLQAVATQLKTNIPIADMNVVNQLPNMITSATNDFTNILIGYASDFLTWVGVQLPGFGACLSLYNAYTDILTIICDNIVVTLNGFWFALGWGLAFMIPAAIFAMKLAKFYLRMDKLEPAPVQLTKVEMLGLKATQGNKPVAAGPNKQQIQRRRRIPPRTTNRVSPMSF